MSKKLKQNENNPDDVVKDLIEYMARNGTMSYLIFSRRFRNRLLSTCSSDLRKTLLLFDEGDRHGHRTKSNA